MSTVRSWTSQHSMAAVFAVLALLLLAFILIPVFKTVFSSSPGTLWDTLIDEPVYSSILLTLVVGLLATLVGAVFAVPLAYLLARRQFRGKRVLEALIDVPIVIPHSAAGIALLFVFGRQFFLGQVFGQVGITFRDTLAGAVVAVMFVSVPFLIDSSRDAFKAVDVRLEKAARTLGASPWRTFFRVSLPLAWRGIFSGSVMMWARAMSEFGAVADPGLLRALHRRAADGGPRAGLPALQRLRTGLCRPGYGPGDRHLPHHLRGAEIPGPERRETMRGERA